MTLRRATSVASPLRMTRNTTARRGGGSEQTRGQVPDTHTRARRATSGRNVRSAPKGEDTLPTMHSPNERTPPLPPRRELTCPSSSSLLVLTMTTSEKREGGTQTHGGVLFFFRLSLSLSLVHGAYFRNKRLMSRTATGTGNPATADQKTKPSYLLPVARLNYKSATLNRAGGPLRVAPSHRISDTNAVPPRQVALFGEAFVRVREARCILTI